MVFFNCHPQSSGAQLGCQIHRGPLIKEKSDGAEMTKTCCDHEWGAGTQSPNIHIQALIQKRQNNFVVSLRRTEVKTSHTLLVTMDICSIGKKALDVLVVTKSGSI